MATEEEKTAIRQALTDVRNPCIVELGAHCGEDEPWLRDACQVVPKYVLVEPDPRNVQMIIREGINYARRGITCESRRVIVGAVAETNATREFWMSDNARTGDHGSGSLRRPTGHIEGMPWITFDRKTMVECYSLDFIFDSQWLHKIDLLWVDIQGAERDMIAGGQMALKYTRYLFMEAEEVELYEGEALKHELIAMLSGWTLLKDFGYNIFLRNENFSDRGPR